MHVVSLQELVATSLISMHRDGCVLRLKGVHVEASTSDRCFIGSFQLILSPCRIGPGGARKMDASKSKGVASRGVCCVAANLQNALVRWVMQGAQRTLVDVSGITVAIENSKIPILRFKLAELKLHTCTESRRSALSWGRLSVSVGNDVGLSELESGHAMIRELAESFDIDIHITSPSFRAPLVADMSFGTLLHTSQGQNQHAYQSRGVINTRHSDVTCSGKDTRKVIQSTMYRSLTGTSTKNASSVFECDGSFCKCQPPQLKIPKLRQTTVRVTILGNVKVIINDNAETATLGLFKLRFVGTSLSFVGKAASVNLRARAAHGMLISLSLCIELAVDVKEWTASMLGCAFLSSDATIFARWRARCLNLLDTLWPGDAHDMINATPVSCRAVVSIASMRVAWILRTVDGMWHLTASLRKTNLSIVSHSSSHASSLWAAELKEGSLWINQNCIASIDATNTHLCRIEVQSIESCPPLSRPALAAYRNKNNREHGSCLSRQGHSKSPEHESIMKTHYVIYIPSFCCLVSCDTIAVTASTTRKFVGNLDDCDSAIVSFDLILGSLAMCLLEDTEEERWDAIDWQQGPPNTLLVTMRGIAITTDNQAAYFKVVDARIVYDNQVVVCKRRSKSPTQTDQNMVHQGLIVGEYAPEGTVSLSIHGAACRLLVPHRRISVLFDATRLRFGTPSSSVVTKWFIVFLDTTLEYIPRAVSFHDLRAVLTVAVLQFCSMSVVGKLTSFASGLMRDTMILLKNKHAGVEIENEAERCNYVQAATIDVIDVVVAADSLKARNIHLYLNGDTARIYCCSDSLQTLIHLFFAVKEEVVEWTAVGGRLEGTVTVGENASSQDDNKSQYVTAKVMGEQSPPLPNSTAVWYDGVYPEMLQDHVSEPNLKSKLRIGMLCSEILCVCVQVREIHLGLFAGCDWGKVQRGRPQNLKCNSIHIQDQRNVNKLLEVVLLCSKFCTSTSTSLQTGCDVRVGDFSVSESLSSPREQALKRMLGHWQSHDAHPRETGEALLHFRALIDGPTTAIKVKLLPLRCCLDAEVINFLTSVFSEVKFQSKDGSPLVRFPCLEPRPAKHECHLVLDVAPLSLKLDYSPRQISVTRLCSDSLDDMFQMFTLERVEVTTRPCRIVSNALASALHRLWRVWSHELSSEQFYRFIQGASIIRPIHVIGRSISRAIHHTLVIKTRPHQWPVFRHELAKCSRVLVCESVRVGRSLVSHLTTALNDIANRLDGHDSSSSLAWNARGTTNDVRAHHFEDARNAIVNGLEDAHQACVAALSRSSPHQLVTVVPVVVLRPTVGLTRATTALLLSLEKTLDIDGESDIPLKQGGSLQF